MLAYIYSEIQHIHTHSYMQAFWRRYRYLFHVYTHSYLCGELWADHLASFFSAVRLLWFMKCPLVAPQSTHVSSASIAFCPADCNATFISSMDHIHTAKPLIIYIVKASPSPSSSSSFFFFLFSLSLSLSLSLSEHTEWALHIEPFPYRCNVFLDLTTDVDQNILSKLHKIYIAEPLLVCTSVTNTSNVKGFIYIYSTIDLVINPNLERKTTDTKQLCMRSRDTCARVSAVMFIKRD